MLGLSFFLEEGVGLERYEVVEKAGRFLCGSSSPLAWKPHSSLLARPPLTAPPPPAAGGAAVRSEAAGLGCCITLLLFLSLARSPPSRACAVRPVPGNSISTSIRTRSRARPARPRGQGRPAARARRSLPPAPHPQPQRQPPQSPKRPRPPRGGRSIWGGSKLAEPLGPPQTLQRRLGEGLRHEQGRGHRLVPSPRAPSPDPCPRPHHARRAGVTGSARSLPAAESGALPGHSERRPGAMSHEPARQQLPAAAPSGLQLPASLQRPPRRRPRPRRPGACPRPGPRASLPPARPSPAASSRRLVLAPSLGGCCTQRWVWPRCPLHGLACGALQRKERTLGSVRSRHVPARPFRTSLPALYLSHSQTPLIPLHFPKFICVAFTEIPFRFLSVPRGGIQWGLCPAVPLG